MSNYSPLAAILNHPNVINKAEKHMQDVASTRQVLTWILSGKKMWNGSSYEPTAKKFIKELDGGSRFEVKLLLVTNPLITTYPKDKTWDLQLNDLGDRAYYNIQSMGGPIPITNYDIDVSASNATNIQDAIEGFLNQASISIVNLLGSNLLAAAGTAGTDDWASMYDMVATSPIADSIGGISSAAYPNWRNYYKTLTAITTKAALLAGITTGLNEATVGMMRPRLAVTDTTTYGLIEAGLQANQRYTPDTELVEAGFVAMKYDACSIIFDPLATAQTMLLLNPEGLKYGVLKNANMKMRPFVDTPNGDLIVGFIRHRGNLLMIDRRTQGILFDIPTSLT